MDSSSFANEIGKGIVTLILLILVAGIAFGLALPWLWSFITAHVSIH